MHDLDLVHRLEAPHCLDEDLPYLAFLDVSFLLFVIANLLKYIATITKLHYDTKY